MMVFSFAGISPPPVADLKLGHCEEHQAWAILLCWGCRAHAVLGVRTRCSGTLHPAALCRLSVQTCRVSIVPSSAFLKDDNMECKYASPCRRTFGQIGPKPNWQDAAARTRLLNNERLCCGAASVCLAEQLRATWKGRNLVLFPFRSRRAYWPVF